MGQITEDDKIVIDSLKKRKWGSNKFFISTIVREWTL